MLWIYTLDTFMFIPSIIPFLNKNYKTQLAPKATFTNLVGPPLSHIIVAMHT